MISNSFHTLLLALMILSLIVQNSSALSVKKLGGRRTSATTAMAWSLQAPEMPFPKSTWYDDVGNPCFRHRNYDDDYTEFRFTTVGSNWPDYAAEKEAPTAVTETKAKRWRAPRIKPLQRLGNLIRRRT